MTNRGYSKVIIEGTVGREPEIRQHPTHGIYAKIYVTTSESSMEDKSGLEKITEEHYQNIRSRISHTLYTIFNRSDFNISISISTIR